MWGPLRSVSKESPSAVSGLSGWNPSICDGPSDRAPTAGVKGPLLLPGPEWQAGRCLRVAQGLLCTPGKPGALSAVPWECPAVGPRETEPWKSVVEELPPLGLQGAGISGWGCSQPRRPPRAARA